MTPVEIVLSVAIVLQSICWLAADYRDFTD